MGNTRVEARVIGRVSRHNSEQDARDDARWAEFGARLAALCAEYPDVVTDSWASEP